MSQDAHHPVGNGPLPPGWDRIDAYLDGELQGPDLSAFEVALASDVALQAEVNAQRSIDESLARLFERDDPVPLPAGAVASTLGESPLRLVGDPAGPAVEAAPRRRPRVWWAAAAMLAAACVGLYVTGAIDIARLFDARNSVIGPEVVYERKVRTGFLPDWVCENDEQFIQVTRDMWGESFLVSSTDDVKIVGWSYYEPVLSAQTAILLATVNNKQVIVAIDRKDNDRSVTLPSSSGLKKYRKVVGNLVFYEISPLDEPRVLPLVEPK